MRTLLGHPLCTLLSLFSLVAARPGYAEEGTATDFSNIVLVRGGLTNLSLSSGPGFEHQFTQRVSGIVSAGFSFRSGRSTLLGNSSLITTGISPGLRFYGGDRALKGAFVGISLPVLMDRTSSDASATTCLGVGVAPEVGVSWWFDRLVVQLAFGVSVVGNLLAPAGTPALGLGCSDGISVALVSAALLGYVF